MGTRRRRTSIAASRSVSRRPRQWPSAHSEQKQRMSAFSELAQPRAVAPMIDHPRQGHERVHRDDAASAQVVANGLLVEQIDPGTAGASRTGSRASRWRPGSTRSASSEVLCITLASSRRRARWVAHQDKDAGPTYSRPARPAPVLQRARRPVIEKLANVAAAGINGGTEHASAIFYGERAWARAAFGLVAHEVARSGSATRSPSATGTTCG